MKPKYVEGQDVLFRATVGHRSVEMRGEVIEIVPKDCSTPRNAIPFIAYKIRQPDGSLWWEAEYGVRPVPVLLQLAEQAL